LTALVKVKPGVEFATIAPAGFAILSALYLASASLGSPLTITSGTDGEHSGESDPHHRGEAYDIRSQDFPEVMLPTVLGSIMHSLGLPQPGSTALEVFTENFYGFLEAAGTPNAHFHVQLRKGHVYG